jgi:hypothetical protein
MKPVAVVVLCIALAALFVVPQNVFLGSANSPTAPAKTAIKPITWVGLPLTEVLPTDAVKLAGTVDLNLGLSIALPNMDQNGLATFLKEVSTPGTPEYDHFLTLSEFDQRYGADPAALTAVENYLASQGLVVNEVYPGSLVIDATGSTQAVSSAFNTGFSWYLMPDGRTVYAPTSNPEVPQSLAQDILGVSGFSNSVKFTPDWAWGLSSYSTLGAGQQFFTPDLQRPNSLPSVYNSTASNIYGKGETIATILWDGERCKTFSTSTGACSNWGGEVGPFNPTWVTSYWNTYLPAWEPRPNVAGVPVDGAIAPAASAEYDGTQGYVESTLDVTMAGSMAPGANITEVYATCDAKPGSASTDGPQGPTDAQIDDAFTTAVTNPSSLASLNNVTVISNSWGAPEFYDHLPAADGGGFVFDATWLSDMKTAAATGITVLAASGDTGNNSVGWPSDIGNDTYGSVAVGGVNENVTGSPSSKGLTLATYLGTPLDGIFTLPQSNAGSKVTGIHQQNVWYFPEGNISTSEYSQGGSMAGPSKYYVEPSWQNYALAGNPENPSPWRGVADIAGVANNTMVELGTYGVVEGLVNATDLLTIAGTSIASPEDAGVLAIVSSALDHKLGFADPTLYSLGYNQTKGKLTTNPFNDVTVGGNREYKAQVGWDYPTGWGTLNASALVANWPASTSSTLKSVDISPTVPTVGASSVTTFTATPVCSSSCVGTTYKWALSSSTLGTISPTTGSTINFTAGTTAGTVGIFVNATLNAVTKGNSTIVTVSSSTVNLTSVALSPLLPSVATGGKIAFSSTPTCSATCPNNITYSWKITDAAMGTLSSTNANATTFTAGTTLGTLGIFINATLGKITKMASTVITIKAVTLTSVALSPQSPTVTFTGNVHFTDVPKCSATCPGNITYAWALTSPLLGTIAPANTNATTFTALSTAGTLRIYVNTTLGKTTLEAYTNITVTPVTLNSVALAPTSPTVITSTIQPFTATPTCSSTCPTSGITYTWTLTSTTLGTITPASGHATNFTAGTIVGTVGIYVNASLGTSTVMGHTVITVSAAPVNSLTSVSVSPTNPTVAATNAQAFTALPVCSLSACPTTFMTYAWALTSTTLGTISPASGVSTTFTALSTAGTVGIFVNATLNGTTQMISTVITVTAPNTLTSVSISPTAPTVASGNTQSFSATPKCTQTPCPSGTTYAWTLTSTTLGSLSSASGSPTTFTAGTSAVTGAIFVNATLNSVTVKTYTVITVTVSTSSLTSVSVSPTTASLATAGTKTFTANPVCTPSCPGSGITYAWTLTNGAMGAVTGSGASVIFTAGSNTGTVGLFVNASLSGTTEGASAEITITGNSQTVTISTISMNPGSANLSTGGTQSFSATPTCVAGGSITTCPTSGISYSWALSNPDGNISSATASSTTFTAGNSAGTVILTVTATLNGASKSVPATIIISTSTTTSTGGLSSTLLLVIIIAVVAVVAIVAVVLLLRKKPTPTPPPPAWNEGAGGAQAPPPPPPQGPVGGASTGYSYAPPPPNAPPPPQ